jgi:uncharacterized protein (TIGR03085 family)
MMGGMTHLALRERRALCDTFERVGPDAPTLCGDWTTAELAAHLVIRERRPDLAAGFYVAPLARRTEQAQDEYAARPWGELVDLFRSGPPSWSPTKVATVDNLVNLGEFFVHHEDVLRAQDGPARELHPRLEDALWTSLRRGARLLLRSAATGGADPLRVRPRPGGRRRGRGFTGGGRRPAGEPDRPGLTGHSALRAAGWAPRGASAAGNWPGWGGYAGGGAGAWVVRGWCVGGAWVDGRA